jgi:hypothetical protein
MYACYASDAPLAVLVEITTRDFPTLVTWLIYHDCVDADCCRTSPVKVDSVLHTWVVGMMFVC